MEKNSSFEILVMIKANTKIKPRRHTGEEEDKRRKT